MKIVGLQNGVELCVAPASRPVRAAAARAVYSFGCVGLVALIGVAVATRVDPAMGAQPADHAERLPPVPAGPLSTGSETDVVPPDTVVEMSVHFLPGNDLIALLARAGIAKSEARQAAQLIQTAIAGPIAKPTEITIFLGDRSTDATRKLEQIRLRPTLDTTLTVNRRTAGDFELKVRRVVVDATPLRISGQVGTNLYWSLRSAGAPAEAASEYLAALLSRSIRPTDVQSGDRFDLILENRRVATGESEPRELLYAGLKRSSGVNIALLRWPQAAQESWIDPTSLTTGVMNAALPVRGKITSQFGLRAHPILGFHRFHRGVDIGAAWGSPIHASGDGWVAHAGWNGGYGFQVQIAHNGGRATSYSHMSRTVAMPGRAVRRGELIGYVGSSGLSTGAHLHYETLINGQPVNPLGQRFTPAAISKADRAALAIRLRQLLSVPIA